MQPLIQRPLPRIFFSCCKTHGLHEHRVLIQQQLQLHWLQTLQAPIMLLAVAMSAKCGMIDAESTKSSVMLSISAWSDMHQSRFKTKAICSCEACQWSFSAGSVHKGSP